MTTAIDSNVLIDLIGEKTVFTDASISALDFARMDGALIICPVVVAALHLAGTTFIRYRQRSAKPRERMLADFLVGAHAQHQADTLLTRDRGYYRTYFPKLHLVDAGVP